MARGEQRSDRRRGSLRKKGLRQSPLPQAKRARRRDGSRTSRPAKRNRNSSRQRQNGPGVGERRGRKPLGKVSPGRGARLGLSGEQEPSRSADRDFQRRNGSCRYRLSDREQTSPPAVPSGSSRGSLTPAESGSCRSGQSKRAGLLALVRARNGVGNSAVSCSGTCVTYLAIFLSPLDIVCLEPLLF